MNQQHVFEPQHINLKLLRFQLIALGGIGYAARAAGISPWRLSRILNGWAKLTTADVEALTNYIAGRQAELGFSWFTDERGKTHGRG